MSAIVTSGIPPVPNAVPIVSPVSISTIGRIGNVNQQYEITHQWMLWFMTVREKVNAINANLIAWSGHAPVSGVPAGTYGDSTHSAVVSVNDFGQVTDITEVPIAGGGSSPLTTKGDLYTFSTDNTRLPVGGDGQILSADSSTLTGLSWIDIPTTEIPLTTKGDILGFDTEPDRIPVGTDGQVLTADSTSTLGVSWKDAPSSVFPYAFSLGIGL